MGTNSLIWMTGAMFVLIGVIGLKLASGAHGGSLYWIGLGTFVVAILAVFYLIKRAFDEQH